MKRVMAGRILMIDDSELSLEFQTALLLRAGHEVRTLGTIRDVTTIAPGWPDVVLVDANMPDASAKRACEVVRERFAAARILLVSGMESEPLRALADTCGADGFVSKSDGIEQLPAVLEEMLAAAAAPVASAGSKRAQLIDKFANLHVERRARLLTCIDAADDPERATEAARLLHTIKGEAKLLGLEEAAKKAAELERLWAEARSDACPEPGVLRATLRRAIEDWSALV
jgi:DNA-binding response OmpR family regulator